MPIPPPGAFAAPADDWTDDPSFDLSTDRSFPGSSPSSSTSSSRGAGGVTTAGTSNSRPSLGMGPSPALRLTGSPLRQMHNLQLKSRFLAAAADDHDDFDDFDIPDDDGPDAGSTIKALPQPLLTFSGGSSGASSATPKGPRTISAASNHSGTSSLRSITATVMGQGPSGVGTITRLGAPKPASHVLPIGSVRARARAIEKQWEADVDFGASEVRLKPALSPANKVIMPDADALDDLGFDMPDDDDQATLKASATLKAMLPPPRARNGSGGDTVKGPPSGFVTQRKPGGPPAREDDLPREEDDLETDLVLPLNLTNLTLASQSQPRALRPRHSMTSVTTDWDSPSTSTSGMARFSWGDESARHGRNSETSMTSVSDGPPEKSKDEFDDDFEEEDYEVDLVIPDPAFFTSRQATVLNSILDKKRKQQFAPPPPAGRPQIVSPHGDGRDDSFEDGIVFDNPRAELSHRRLEKSRRMRTVPVPFALGAERNKPKAPASDKDKDGDRERLGRQSPSVPMNARQGASSSLGRASGRNLSGGSHKDTRSRPTSPLTYMREPPPARAPSRNRLTAGSFMPPPPIPPPPPMPPSSLREPTTPSRLRHQKSFHHLPPSPSPSLVRKQSLASLQDAIAAGHVRPDSELAHYDDRHPLRQQKSASRLTQPTTSSLAKMRAPISHMTSREQLRPPPVPRVRTMEMPRRTRHWGDGTELEGIEDLRVDPPATPSYPKLGRKSLDKSPSSKEEPQRKKSGGKPRRQRQPAMLIKNLGAVDKKKVVGEMTWNPQTLRWEGNEAILRDFDTVASSARPALITHYTGNSAPHSPLNGGGAPAVRIVGDMKFDPEKMCWVSLLPPEEDEPDPFEGMADDEDDAGLRGTLTRLSGRKLVSIGLNSGSSAPSAPSTRFVSESAHSVATTTASWEDRTLPQVGTEIPPELWAECRDAEDRHRREMRGWTLRPAQSSSDLRDRERREEKRLWEVRNLALRS